MARTRKDVHLSGEIIEFIEDIAERTGSPIGETMRTLLEDAALAKYAEMLDLEKSQRVIRKMQLREERIKQGLENLAQKYSIPTDDEDFAAIIEIFARMKD